MSYSKMGVVIFLLILTVLNDNNVDYICKNDELYIRYKHLNNSLISSLGDLIKKRL